LDRFGGGSDAIVASSSAAFCAAVDYFSEFINCPVVLRNYRRLKIMEEFSPESLEYLKRHVPGFTEFLATPDDQKDAYLLRKINEKNAEYGLAPID
jgi:hypothetical protein